MITTANGFTTWALWIFNTSYEWLLFYFSRKDSIHFCLKHKWNVIWRLLCGSISFIHSLSLYVIHALALVFGWKLPKPTKQFWYMLNVLVFYGGSFEVKSFVLGQSCAYGGYCISFLAALAALYLPLFHITFIICVHPSYSLRHVCVTYVTYVTWRASHMSRVKRRVW